MGSGRKGRESRREMGGSYKKGGIVRKGPPAPATYPVGGGNPGPLVV